MKIPGICSICSGVAKPANSCSGCGAVVCTRCYSGRDRMCSLCRQKV